MPEHYRPKQRKDSTYPTGISFPIIPVSNEFSIDRQRERFAIDRALRQASTLPLPTKRQTIMNSNGFKCIEIGDILRPQVATELERRLKGARLEPVFVLSFHAHIRSGKRACLDAVPIEISCRDANLKRAGNNRDLQPRQGQE